MNYFSTLVRKIKASQILLAMFLTFSISASVANELTAEALVIEEADYISETLELRDHPESRDSQAAVLLHHQAGVFVAAFRQYTIRASGLVYHTGFSPHILPIRGSPRT